MNLLPAISLKGKKKRRERRRGTNCGEDWMNWRQSDVTLFSITITLTTLPTVQFLPPHEPALEVEDVYYHAARLLALSLRRLSIHYMQKLSLLVKQNVSQWHS
ncbi:hypothetical protein KM043_000612 [Ampulex compressa]|nr:hypothetical protein KM043_000612 [Ampulex compressa]